MRLHIMLVALAMTACVEERLTVVRTVDKDQTETFCESAIVCTRDGDNDDSARVRMRGTFRVGAEIPGEGVVVHKRSEGMKTLGITFLVLATGLGALSVMSAAGTFGNGPYGGNSIGALAAGIGALSFAIPGIPFVIMGVGSPSIERRN
jgi:hypothetical protein